MGTPRFCHVTPLLLHLHWLPICYHVKFKILLLIFKCLCGLAPNYLIELISIKKQSRYSLSKTSLCYSSYRVLRPVQPLAIVHSSQLRLISGMHYLQQFGT